MIDQNIKKCVFDSLDFQNFAGEHAPGPPRKARASPSQWSLRDHCSLNHVLSQVSRLPFSNSWQVCVWYSFYNYFIRLVVSVDRVKNKRSVTHRMLFFLENRPDSRSWSNAHDFYFLIVMLVFFFFKLCVGKFHHVSQVVSLKMGCCTKSILLLSLCTSYCRTHQCWITVFMFGIWRVRRWRSWIFQRWK